MTPRLGDLAVGQRRRPVRLRRADVLRNLFPNPSSSDAAGALKVLTAWGAGGAAGGVSYLAGSGITPTTYTRMTVTAGGSWLRMSHRPGVGGAVGMPIRVGETYTVSAMVRSSAEREVRPYIGAYAGSTFRTESYNAFTIPANTWTRVTHTRETTTVDATGLGVWIHLSTPLAGDTLDVTGWSLMPGTTAASVSGDSPGWWWLGEPHASESAGYSIP